MAAVFSCLLDAGSLGADNTPPGPVFCMVIPYFAGGQEPLSERTSAAKDGLPPHSNGFGPHPPDVPFRDIRILNREEK